jgi:NADH-quinone oxidoreductase subunit J
MVVVNRHPVHSALYLVLTFFGLSLFYLQLHAPFLAVVQIIVYAGAIMVLFMFVIMLLGEDKVLPTERSIGVTWPFIVGAVLIVAAQIGYLISRNPRAPLSPARDITIIGGTQESFGSVKALGNTLFTDYLFAFEATSVILLVAMVGVVVLAKKKL